MLSIETLKFMSH